MKYHINPETGNPNQCRAKTDNCPFGADEDHYPDKDTARAAYAARAEAEGLDAVPAAVKTKLVRDMQRENLRAQREVSNQTQNVEMLDRDIARNEARLPNADWEHRAFEEEYGSIRRDSFFANNDRLHTNMKNDPSGYSFGERVMIKALRWADFGMLGSATGAAAGTAIFASQGRPGMAAIMGSITALMSAPQWWPAVKAKVEVWRQRRELEDKRPAVEREIKRLKNVRSSHVANLLESQKQAALVEARMNKALGKKLKQALDLTATEADLKSRSVEQLRQDRSEMKDIYEGALVTMQRAQNDELFKQDRIEDYSPERRQALEAASERGRAAHRVIKLIDAETESRKRA